MKKRSGFWVERSHADKTNFSFRTSIDTQEEQSCMRDQMIAIILGWADPVEVE